jgi:phage shock protein PspC (stress-responsive transcriptional regulator)
MTESASPTVEQAAPAHHGPWLPPPVHAKLVRSRSDRKLAGVAGGLGQYTGIDPLIFRIVLVVLAIFGGSGLLLYGLGWLFIPAEGEPEPEAHRLVRGRGTLRVVAAAGLVVVGLFIFGETFSGGPGPGFGNLVALAVIGIAAYLVLRSNGGTPRAGADTAAAAAGGSTGGSPIASGAYGQTPGTAYFEPSGAAAMPAAPTYPPDPSAPVPPYYPPPPGGPQLTNPPVPPPPRAPRERSMLGRLTLSAVLLVVGLVLAFRAAATEPASLTVVPAAALATVGIGLLIGTFYGRARWLILVGAVLTLATGAAAAADSVGKEGIGIRTWAPSSVADVRPEYRLGLGDATLDLSQLSVPAGERVVVDAEVEVGELDVLVPADATIQITSQTESGGTVWSTGAGGFRALDEGQDRYTRTGDGSAGTIELDLRVGLGSLTIHDTMETPDGTP